MTELVDPQLEAFAEQYVEGPAAFGPSVPAWYDNTVVELAGAIIAMRGLVALTLSRQPTPPVGQAAAVAGQAWRQHGSSWLQLTVPTITQAYRAGRIRGLSQAELEAMATDYAEGLGAYLDTTSGEALAEGFEQQLMDRWDGGLAWHRVSAGYGLDRPSMRSYLSTVLAQPKESRDSVGTAGRMLADRLLLARADRVAQTEAWTASQAGLATSWLVLQRRGQISPDAARRWRTRRRETACPVCSPMDGQQVPLDQPFTAPTGEKLWAPAAHPDCQCSMQLVEPVAKAKKLEDGTLDPYDRTQKGRFARHEERTRVVTHLAEPLVLSPEAQAIIDQVTGKTAPEVENPFKLPRPEQGKANPFAGAGASPFGVSNPFARQANPFAAAGPNPFAAPKGANPFDQTKKPSANQRSLAPKRRVIIHNIFTPKKSTEEKQENLHLGSAHHLNYQEWASAFEMDDLGALTQPGDRFDFTDLAAGHADQARYSFTTDTVHELLDQAVDHEHPMFPGMISARRLRDEFPELIDTYAAKAFQTDRPWDLIPDIEDRANDSEMDADQAWPEIYEHAGQIWHDVVDDPQEHIAGLTRPDIDMIYDMAGYERHEDDDVARERIKDHVETRGLGDDSLANAFADYVTWNGLKSTGTAGEDLRVALQTTDEGHLPHIGQDFGARHAGLAETFAFENGFHPDTAVSERGKSARLTDHYSVKGVTYRSAIAEGEKIPFITGLRELYMQPTDAEGHPLYGGPYSS